MIQLPTNFVFMFACLIIPFLLTDMASFDPSSAIRLCWFLRAWVPLRRVWSLISLFVHGGFSFIITQPITVEVESRYCRLVPSLCSGNSLPQENDIDVLCATKWCAFAHHISFNCSSSIGLITDALGHIYVPALRLHALQEPPTNRLGNALGLCNLDTVRTALGP